MIWLKLVHLAAIALWSAGLAGLPLLYLQYSRNADRKERDRLHAMGRFLYVAVLSPAAFIAIGSGAALIFVRHVFEGWFSLKLALVGLLVGLHIFTGLAVRRRDAGPARSSVRSVLTAAAILLVAAMILAVVLAKPQLPDLLPAALAEPGALSRLVLSLFPRS